MAKRKLKLTRSLKGKLYAIQKQNGSYKYDSRCSDLSQLLTFGLCKLDNRRKYLSLSNSKDDYSPTTKNPKPVKKETTDG